MGIAAVFLSPWTVVALALAYYLHPYLITYASLRDIPGPLLARLSNLWLFLTARRGKRYLIVHETHQKYGPVVRIQPNHVSINDDSVIQTIYGHGNGFLKA